MLRLARLGFFLPEVESPYKSCSTLSANTMMDNHGMMIWDGGNIRVWTGGTLWATVTLT